MSTDILNHIDKEILLWWFMLTNWDILAEMQKLRKEKEAMGINAKYKKANSYYLDMEKAWWEIFAIDPDNIRQGKIASLDVYIPSWILYDKEEKKLYVWSDYDIKIIQKWKIIQKLDHDLFNCLHSINFENGTNNLIVCSSWIDTILCVNKNTYVLEWYRNAHENWYVNAPYGYKKIDLSQKHQWIDYPTNWHTTHLNCSINHKEYKLLSTFFHQWELVEIDLKTWKTNIILKDMIHPHAIKQIRIGYMLCDTWNWEIIFLDQEFNIIKKIITKSTWLQDAVLLEDDSIVFCDWSNGLITKIDWDWNELDEWDFGKQKRIGRLTTIRKSELYNIF